jgi:hypothetical protein
MEVTHLNANELIKGSITIRIKWSKKARLRIMLTKWLIILIKKIGVCSVEIVELKVK